MLDPIAAERAEREIDRFINSRSEAKDKANAEAAMWQLSERRHREKRQRENAAAWREYHTRVADNLERTAAELAAAHRAKAEKFSAQNRRVIAEHDRSCLTNERREQILVGLQWGGGS